MPTAEAPPPDLSRVVVVGSSSAGKTTFARELAGRLAVDHVELDRLHWLPGWTERAPAQFRDLVDERTAGRAWVTDGNYKTVRDLLWTRATAVIWLDYAFPLVLWRALRRAVHNAATGQETCNGNRETWRLTFFSRDSILLWVISTYHERRRRYDALFAADDYPGAVKIRLSTPAAAAAFLAAVRPT